MGEDFAGEKTFIPSCIHTQVSEETNQPPVPFPAFGLKRDIVLVITAACSESPSQIKEEKEERNPARKRVKKKLPRKTSFDLKERERKSLKAAGPKRGDDPKRKKKKRKSFLLSLSLERKTVAKRDFIHQRLAIIPLQAKADFYGLFHCLNLLSPSLSRL